MNRKFRENVSTSISTIQDQRVGIPSCRNQWDGEHCGAILSECRALCSDTRANQTDPVRRASARSPPVNLKIHNSG